MKQYKYLEKLAKGKTVIEVAMEYGVTPGSVYAALKRVAAGTGARPCPCNIVYPKIAQWMRENGCTLRDVAKAVGANGNTLRRNLNGSTKISLETALKIGKLMNEYVEVVFYRDE